MMSSTLYCAAPEVTVEDMLFSTQVAAHLTITPATKECAPAILRFLAERPLHTVMMSGLILENGIVSPFNRGTFFVCHDFYGKIEGVALFGHNTFIDVRSPGALVALARYARANELHARRIIGEEHIIRDFGRIYAAPERAPRHACTELLLELRTLPAAPVLPLELRLASQHDLESVIVSHAEVVFSESGVNPLTIDPAGFSARALRRVAQQRTWVVSDGKRLIFKADLAAVTPEVAYLEGIYVDPQERGKGWGLRCLSQLSRQLLARHQSVCLLVNEQNIAARNLYHKVGYALYGRYLALSF